jgi:hypothetical protein
MKLVRQQKVTYDTDGNIIDPKPIMFRYIPYRWFIDNEDYLWVDADCPNQTLEINIPFTRIPIVMYHRNT